MKFIICVNSWCRMTTLLVNGVTKSRRSLNTTVRVRDFLKLKLAATIEQQISLTNNWSQVVFNTPQRSPRSKALLVGPNSWINVCSYCTNRFDYEKYVL